MAEQKADESCGCVRCPFRSECTRSERGDDERRDSGARCRGRCTSTRQLKRLGRRSLPRCRCGGGELANESILIESKRRAVVAFRRLSAATLLERRVEDGTLADAHADAKVETPCSMYRHTVTHHDGNVMPSHPIQRYLHVIEREHGEPSEVAVGMPLRQRARDAHRSGRVGEDARGAAD